MEIRSAAFRACVKNDGTPVFESKKGFKSPSPKIKTRYNRIVREDFSGVLFFTQALQAASTSERPRAFEPSARAAADTVKRRERRAPATIDRHC